MDLLPGAHEIHCILNGNRYDLWGPPNKSHPAVCGLDELCAKVDSKAARSYIHVSGSQYEELGAAFKAFRFFIKRYFLVAYRVYPRLRITDGEWLSDFRLHDSQHFSIEVYAEMSLRMVEVLLLKDKGVQELNENSQCSARVMVRAFTKIPEVVVQTDLDDGAANDETLEQGQKSPGPGADTLNVDTIDVTKREAKRRKKTDLVGRRSVRWCKRLLDGYGKDVKRTTRP